MFAAITQVSNLQGKRGEETQRDTMRESVYAQMNAIQALVDSCQISPDEGVTRATAAVNAYYQKCDAFQNKSVSDSCRNYERQDYPGGAQYGAFNTRRARIRAGGGDCNKPTPVAPAVIRTPTVVAPVLTPSNYVPPTGSGLGPGCCNMSSGNNLSIGLDGGNLGLTVGSRGGGSGYSDRGAQAPQGIVEKISAAIDNAVHGGASILGADNGGGIGGGSNTPIYSSAQVVDFPMEDAYSPITDTGSPVPGMNAWPWTIIQDNLSLDTLGRSFIRQPDVSLPGVKVSTFNQPGGQGQDAGGSFSGFGDDVPTIEVGDLGTVTTTYAPQAYPQGIGVSGPSKFQSILDTLKTILPATISAIKGQPYYNTAQQQATGQFNTGLPQTQQLQTGGGAGANIGSQAGAAVGSIGDTISNIVTQNPLLVLGGGLAVLLLFMKPPSRR